jgi:hypothetical protein
MVGVPVAARSRDGPVDDPDRWRGDHAAESVNVEVEVFVERAHPPDPEAAAHDPRVPRVLQVQMLLAAYGSVRDDGNVVRRSTRATLSAQRGLP